MDLDRQPTAPVLQPLSAGSTVTLFRTLFGHTQEAALLTRPSGLFLAANPAACALFGATEEALCRRSQDGGHVSLADAGDPRLQQLLAERAQRGHARGELRLRRFDGQPFDAEVSSFLFLDEAGECVTILTVRDVSALRLAERLARESETRLNFALEAADIGDWDMDLRTNVARRSLRHDRCFGYAEPVAVWGYDTFLAHIHAEDRTRVDACYQKAMAGEGDYDVEFRVVWPDGSLHWLWSRGCFYFDDEGQPYRVAGIQVDVTERRTTLQALQRSEERLQLVMRGANDAPWDLDLVTREPYYSPRWLQMLGYDAAPAGDPAAAWLELCHPDDAQRVHDFYRAALQGTADTYEIEFRLRHRDGHYLPVQSRGFVLRGPDGSARRVSGVNTDLTQRHRLREAQERQAVAEAANAAKSEFLSHMSHELRTPLNAVIGFAQLLAADSAPAPEKRRAHAQHIGQAGWHLLNMIDEILDLSRIEAAQFSLQYDEVDVATLLQECCKMVEPAAAGSAVRVRVRDGEAVPRLVTDRTRLRQVLLNLLSNAVKYSHEGGEVTLSSRALDDGGVEFAVQDGGPGMSPAQIGQLFVPFNRLGRESGGVPGTGIGLVISKRLVEALGGRIGVRSEPGVGSVFTVRLRGAPAQAAVEPGLPALPAALPAALAGAAAGSGLWRVSYVEDNAVNAELMRAIVALRPGIALEVHERAEEALAAARALPPHLILLDLQLPGMSGLELLAVLKSEPATAATPVIVLSASAMPETIDSAMAAGALRYLTKPIDHALLLAAIDACLGSAAEAACPAAG